MTQSAWEGKKMTVEASPPPATAAGVSTLALATDSRAAVKGQGAPATGLGMLAPSETPPPAAPGPRQAAAKPNGAKLQRDAEEAVKHYGHDKVEYQSKLLEIYASKDTPETKQDRVTNAYLLVSHSWDNAKRAAAAYLEFAKSEDNFRELDDATAKIQLGQLEKKPHYPKAVIERAKAACERAAIAYAQSSERVKSAQKLLVFAQSYPEHPDPLPSLKPPKKH
jgi:hypothetical protein